MLLAMLAVDPLRLHLNVLDFAILIVYFGLVITIGVLARRAIATSEDFLLAGRSLPAWITGLAFISANLGAIEILGMAANGAQVRLGNRSLLLDRCRPSYGLPRSGDDALLLWLAGAQRS